MSSRVGSSLHASRSYGDLFVLAWFVASAATVAGGLGTGLESDEAIRAAVHPNARRSVVTDSRANRPRQVPVGYAVTSRWELTRSVRVEVWLGGHLSNRAGWGLILHPVVRIDGPQTRDR